LTSNSEKTRWVRVTRYSFIAGLILLAVQYMTGVIANIYAVPPYGPNNIGVHYVMGDVLVLAGLIIVIMAALSRLMGPIAFGVAGLASVLIAGESGREFAFITQQSGIYSFSMALFWLTAFIVYFLGQQSSSISKGEAT
jgi:hypothetical protein